MGPLARASLIHWTEVIGNVQNFSHDPVLHVPQGASQQYERTPIINKNLPSDILLDVTACVGCAACTFSSTFAALVCTASFSCCAFIFSGTN
jgi:hypothetical protein